MKHIYTYIFFVFISLQISKSTEAQELLVDSLDEFTFTLIATEVSEVYQLDSVPHQILRENFSLVDALRNSQAVYLKDYGPGNIASLTLRGGNAQQVAVFWNGMRINSPTLGLTDISLLPAAFFSSVSIAPGSSSLLAGAGGLSGGLYLSSQPEKRAKYISLDHRLTPSLGATNTQLVSNTSKEGFSARTAVIFSSADNRFDYIDDSSFESQLKSRVNAGSRSVGFSNDLQVELSPRSQISSSIHFLHQNREIASPIGIPNRDENQEDQVFRAFMSYRLVGKRIVHQLAAGIASEYLLYTAPPLEIRSEIRSKRAHLRYQNSLELMPGLLLTSRVDHEQSQAISDSNEFQDVQEFGLFTGLERTWSSNTKVHLGGRLEWMNGVANPYTASIGVEHRLKWVKGLWVAGTASKNFRNPTLNDLYWPDLGDPNLKAENGYSADASLHYDFFKNGIRLTYFINEMENLIQWTPSSDGNFRPQNFNRSRAEGIEINLQIEDVISDQLDISYTYTSSEVERGESPIWTQNLYQPRHLFNVSTWQEIDEFRLGFTSSYSSEVSTDHTLTPDSYLKEILLLDAHFKWQPKGELKGFQVGFSIKNLMDRNYEFVRDRPIPGMHLQFQLNIYIDEKN